MVALGWPGNDYNVISFKEFEQSCAKWSDSKKLWQWRCLNFPELPAGRNGSSDTPPPNFLGSRSIARGGDSS